MYKGIKLFLGTRLADSAGEVSGLGMRLAGEVSDLGTRLAGKVSGLGTRLAERLWSGNETSEAQKKNSCYSHGYN